MEIGGPNTRFIDLYSPVPLFAVTFGCESSCSFLPVIHMQKKKEANLDVGIRGDVFLSYSCGVCWLSAPVFQASPNTEHHLRSAFLLPEHMYLHLSS